MFLKSISAALHYLKHTNGRSLRVIWPSAFSSSPLISLLGFSFSSCQSPAEKASFEREQSWYYNWQESIQQALKPLLRRFDPNINFKDGSLVSLLSEFQIIQRFQMLPVCDSWIIKVILYHREKSRSCSLMYKTEQRSKTSFVSINGTATANLRLGESIRVRHFQYLW